MNDKIGFIEIPEIELDDLPKNEAEAILFVVEEFFKFTSKILNKPPSEFIDHYLSYYGVFLALNEIHSSGFKEIDIHNEPSQIVKQITDFINNLKSIYTKIIFEEKILINKNKFVDKIGVVSGEIFAYEFSENDFKRAQILISELRDLISNSSDFEEDYKFKRIFGL